MRNQIALITLCMSLTACATIFDKTTDNISFTSEPSDANIYLNGRLMGKTPTSFQVNRSPLSGSMLQIAVEKEGYKRQAFELTKELNKIAIFNLCFVASWATDFFSGAAMRYSPTDYRIFLENEHAAYRPHEMGVQKFALFNFEKIQEDIARGGGEYLESMALLTAPVDKKDALLKKILNESDYLKASSPSEMIYLLKRDRQSFN